MAYLYNVAKNRKNNFFSVLTFAGKIPSWENPDDYFEERETAEREALRRNKEVEAKIKVHPLELPEKIKIYEEINVNGFRLSYPHASEGERELICKDYCLPEPGNYEGIGYYFNGWACGKTDNGQLFTHNYSLDIGRGGFFRIDQQIQRIKFTGVISEEKEEEHAAGWDEEPEKIIEIYYWFTWEDGTKEGASKY